jgi:hypothetical protein
MDIDELPKVTVAFIIGIRRGGSLIGINGLPIVDLRRTTSLGGERVSAPTKKKYSWAVSQSIDRFWLSE